MLLLLTLLDSECPHAGQLRQLLLSCQPAVEGGLMSLADTWLRALPLIDNVRPPSQPCLKLLQGVSFQVEPLMSHEGKLQWTTHSVLLLL